MIASQHLPSAPQRLRPLLNSLKNSEANNEKSYRATVSCLRALRGLLLNPHSPQSLSILFENSAVSAKLCRLRSLSFAGHAFICVASHCCAMCSSQSEEWREPLRCRLTRLRKLDLRLSPEQPPKDHPIFRYGKQPRNCYHSSST